MIKIKKELTNQAIYNDIKAQKGGLLSYFGGILWITFIFVFATMFNPVVYLCGVVAIFMFLKVIKDDIKRIKPKFYVIERPCHDKDIYESDDSPDCYRLWFLNKNQDWILPFEVKKEEYDLYEIGDEFYVVFLEKDKSPCLIYSKKEYELI